MISLGLSAAELRAFHATLKDHHAIRVRVHTLTTGGDYDVDLTGHLIDGQVTVDGSNEITRTCSVTLSDPRRNLPFDSDSPASTALFMDRLVRVHYDVAVGDSWQPVPVFTGPVSKLSRDGETITVEANGMEAFALGSIWRPLTLRKGMRKTDAIRRLLSERAGETRFSIPSLSSRLTKTISLDREAVAWATARSLARGLNRQLYYDGAGVCRLRSYPGAVAYRFDGSNMTSAMHVDYGGEPINAVQVTGATPKGHKTPITYCAVAPSSNPLSAWRLGRNGVPRYLVRVVSKTDVATIAEAKALAERTLDDALRETVEATFDALPVPHLEPGDLVHVSTDVGSVTFRLTKFSLPLTTASAMSVGYTRNVSLAHHRRHR